MERPKRWMAAINLIGGPAVLGSYAWGAQRYPDVVGRLWGDLPDVARGPYTWNMFLAAAGYLIFSWFLWRHVDARRARVAGAGFGVFNVAYAGILLFSALWMPLSLHALTHGAEGLVPWIVTILLLVAGSTVLMVTALFRVRPVSSRGWQRAAQVGALFFALQTVVLDALIWPWFFSV